MWIYPFEIIRIIVDRNARSLFRLPRRSDGSTWLEGNTSEYWAFQIWTLANHVRTHAERYKPYIPIDELNAGLAALDRACLKRLAAAIRLLEDDRQLRRRAGKVLSKLHVIETHRNGILPLLTRAMEEVA